MHLCLLIPELVEIIILNINYHKPTLARLACVCTALRDPSLDALYWRVESFGDLLRVLPCKDLISVCISSSGNLRRKCADPSTLRGRWDTSELTTRITQRQWNTFAAYAARVRHIKVDFALGIPGYSSRSVCRAFPDRCPIPSLFPNLRSLHISGGPSVFCPRFVDRLCLGPEVRDIRFNYLTINTFMDSISSPEQFASRVPLLERLSAPTYNTADTLQHLAQYIPQWPNLTTLSCGPLDTNCLTSLSLLRSFRHLELLLGEDTIWIEEDRRFGLSRLESLKIECSTFEKSAKALVAVLSRDLRPHQQHDKLRYLSIHASSSSAGSVQTLTEALSRLVSSHALREITLEDSLFKEAGLQKADDVEWIHPLLHFSHLTNFTILRTGMAHYSLYSLTGHQLLSVVRKWPQLEVLRVLHLKSLLTLPEAIALIGTLPRLSAFDVGIQVTHEDVATLGDSSVPLPCNDYITALSMHCEERTMHPGDDFLLAFILTRVFPRLSTIYNARLSHGRSAEVQSSSFWVKVNDEVTAIKENIALS
ncbi:hypothetical protein CONPUDRAFT_170291 [Coniophora puteana RWD-64-598 SS2]|uniref:F-box domain-containing protein n=1 Tax=Coniophora puteana (strain RWD-64-598) TaxID=741705 RepID=R7SDQ9_CONPW|nr:uncharacterized protein CONPUDRAFT_170291 [Coniophora puteana RWD-64-598 SS2]EIW74301.1 hypothetical protein CONPUDRAFT_170291 [Coniophora puteana RWD-64-598 SS2]